ncbi:unnamed protein product [Gadus morhua 'NCC']
MSIPNQTSQAVVIRGIGPPALRAWAMICSTGLRWVAPLFPPARPHGALQLGAPRLTKLTLQEARNSRHSDVSVTERNCPEQRVSTVTNTQRHKATALLNIL